MSDFYHCTTYESYRMMENAATITGEMVVFRGVLGLSEEYRTDQMPFLCAGNYCSPTIPHSAPYIDFPSGALEGSLTASRSFEWITLNMEFVNESPTGFPIRSLVVLATPTDEPNNRYALMAIKPKSTIFVPPTPTLTPLQPQNVVKAMFLLKFPNSSSLISI